MNSNDPASEIQCVSETCAYKLDPSWDFCPYCGADNRPPSRRQDPVRPHVHRYLHRVGCCLICGEPFDEPYYFRRIWRVRIASTLLALSLASAFVALNIGLAGAGKPSIAKSYIQSWYDSPTFHYSRRRLGPRHSILGRDRIIDFLLISVGTGVLGGLMLFKQPLRWFDKRDGW